MSSNNYPEGYWERGEGSNYTNYGDDPGWGATSMILSTLLGHGSSVLEVGAAKGYLVRCLRRFGLDAWGTDISQYAVSHACDESFPYMRLSNAVELPFTDWSFDAVISMEMLEHVYEDEVNDVLDEMIRVCKSPIRMIHRICLKTDDNYAHQDDDHTHVLVKPRVWWTEKFAEYDLYENTEAQDIFDGAFSHRDWAGRFFVLENR